MRSRVGSRRTSAEQALGDVLAAVGRLDAGRLRGPYSLALSPARYNALFRRHEGSDMLQLDHGPVDLTLSPGVWEWRGSASRS